MTINSIQSPSINFDVKRGTPPAAGVPKTMARMLQFLKNFEHGVLRIVLPDGAATCVGNGTEQVTLKLHNWKVATAVLKSGDIGFAQSYIDGDWETDDLPGLLALVARNRAAAEKLP